MQQAVDAAEVDKRAVVGEVLHDAGEHGVLAQLLERAGPLGGLLFFENFLAADHHIAALLVELDDTDFNLLAEIAVKIPHRANLKLRAGQERLEPDIDGQPALDAADDCAHHRGLVVGGLLDHVPNAQALGALVAHQVTAFGLLALDDYVDHVTGMELHRTGVVKNLLQRDKALGLQAHHIDDQMLVSLLDDRSGDKLVAVGFNCGGLGSLLAFKRRQCGGEIVGGLVPMRFVSRRRGGRRGLGGNFRHGRGLNFRLRYGLSRCSSFRCNLGDRRGFSNDFSLGGFGNDFSLGGFGNDFSLGGYSNGRGLGCNF